MSHCWFCYLVRPQPVTVATMEPGVGSNPKHWGWEWESGGSLILVTAFGFKDLNTVESHFPPSVLHTIVIYLASFLNSFSSPILLPLPPTPRHLQTTTWLHFVTTENLHFLEFYMCGIIQYVVFLFWLLVSTIWRLIHVVTCIKFLFLAHISSDGYTIHLSICYKYRC